MNKSLLYLAISILLFIWIAVAIPFSPQGDIELRGTYALLNATNVTATRATIGGVVVNTSGVFTNSTQTTSANQSWTHYGYPVACPANSYVTQVADSITCTAVTTIPDNVVLSKNMTVAENNTICIDGDACTRYIRYNGTATIIQG